MALRGTGQDRSVPGMAGFPGDTHGETDQGAGGRQTIRKELCKPAMKVLVACEFSGIVRDAFAAKGHDAWSCDLLPSERNGKHIQGDVREILLNGWDLMIAHPPCTYLSNAGVRHLHSIPSRNGVLTNIHGFERLQLMKQAAAFFNELADAPIERIAIENPTPHKYARELIGPYQQAVQPWYFDVPETKRTCLWLKNLPPLMCTIIETTRYPKTHMTSPGADRWMKRSRTPVKFAEAMANQWG